MGWGGKSSNPHPPQPPAVNPTKRRDPLLERTPWMASVPHTNPPQLPPPWWRSGKTGPTYSEDELNDAAFAAS